MYPLYDSRCGLYKSINQAVPAGQPLRLRLLLRGNGVRDISVHITSDTNGYDDWVMLEYDEAFDNGVFYAATVTLPDGLYWYTFGFNDYFGYHTVGRGEHGLGVLDSNTPFQITVYDENFVTPDFIKGGIIYQIFPDRFFCSKTKKNGVPKDRYIAENWGDAPAYLQTDDKRRLNNDYFCGDIKGIIQKLDYLEGLGVTCIYLNPVFEAHSNHRYNTADYSKIDPLLGDEKDLSALCKKAKAKGMAVILDGVFSHTGDDSVYFNKNKRYGESGAYNDKNSEYYGWYKFDAWPEKYSAWWGVPSLPETDENNKDFTEYICGENGILRRYIKMGVSGWRLDVADELPDEFLESIRKAVKAENPQALILGEVWEDATNKISYGARRKFLLGKQLDTVMNYPFAEAIISFVCGGDSDKLADAVMDICENYPPCALHSLMNHIGTHDTARILTRLGCDNNLPKTREEQANFALTDEQYNQGIKRLRLAAALQYTLPGVPSVYYGDEAGMQGGKDPFCRGTFPWDNINENLLDFYKKLGKIRRNNSAFVNGGFLPLPQSGLGHLAFIRKGEEQTILVCVNRWCDTAQFSLPQGYAKAKVLYGNRVENGTVTVNGEDIFIAEIQ